MHRLATMQYGRLKTLHYMSRNAIGHRQGRSDGGYIDIYTPPPNHIPHRYNGKVPRDSVAVAERSPRHQGPTYKLQVPVFRLKSLKFSRTLQTQNDNYDYDAPESR